MSLTLFGHDLSGTTAQRPTNAETGQPYFNTDTGLQEVNDGGGGSSFSPVAGQRKRNIIQCGDFSTNPWQRGNAAAVANTVTYGPDRFFALGGASSSIYLTKTANTAINGFSQACAFGRTSGNANLTAINFGQVIETLNSLPAQGKQVTLSFWAKAGANYSPVTPMTVKLFSGTGTDDTAANMFAGSWAGSATPISATFTPTGTMQRFQFTGTVAATATQLGILLSMTPVGTAGTADNVLIMGVQLEIGSVASGFAFQDAAEVLEIAQRYCWQINETANGVFGNGMNSATNVQTIQIPTPVQMRAVPTVTVSAGGFKFNLDGTQTAVGGGFAAGSVQAINSINVVGAVTATVGKAIQLTGSLTTGKITASAEF